MFPNQIWKTSTPAADESGPEAHIMTDVVLIYRAFEDQMRWRFSSLISVLVQFFSSFLLKVAKGFLVIGAAPIFWVLWKTKNKSCFKCVRPGDPTTVVFYVCQFLTSWTTFAEGGF